MKRGEARALLEVRGIDWYCEQIIAGQSMTATAKRAGVSMSVLWDWLRADPVRLERSREARELSAQAHLDRAVEAIISARTPLALSKARELAQHHRWAASKISPRDWGDKLEVSGAGGTPLIPEMTPERVIEGARRMAFVLQRAAQLVNPQAAADAPRIGLHGEAIDG